MQGEAEDGDGSGRGGGAEAEAGRKSAGGMRGFKGRAQNGPYFGEKILSCTIFRNAARGELAFPQVGRICSARGARWGGAGGQKSAHKGYFSP